MPAYQVFAILRRTQIDTQLEQDPKHPQTNKVEFCRGWYLFIEVTFANEAVIILLPTPTGRDSFGKPERDIL